MNVMGLGLFSNSLPDSTPRTATGVAAAEQQIPPLALWLLLASIVLFAYYLRCQYWLIAGGLQSQYVDWSWSNHYGGIGETNLQNAQRLYNGEFAKINRYYPVGYPALIALVKFFGVSDPQIYRLVQTALDALASLLAYAVVRKLGAGQIAAIVGAGAYAITPSWAWGSTLIMGESLLPALTLLFLFVLLSLAPRSPPAAWFFAGIAVGFLPLFRPEMSLLVVPWALWAIIHGGPERMNRFAVGLAALIGFAIPWNGVALYNYWTHGQYFITDNIAAFALFTGLGQLPNPYGYFVDDERAIQFLRSMGLEYRSPEAERYWRAVYWNAWREHPGYVLQTILHRFKLILYGLDLPSRYFRGLRDLANAGPVLLLAAGGLLAMRRRYTHILIIAGPLLYAMATNGLMYTELRYVRYAHLSYLLAGCLLLDGLLSVASRAAPYLGGGRTVRYARIVAIIIVMVPVCVWIARETYALQGLARRVVIAFGLRDVRSHGGELVAGSRWRPLVQGADVQVRDGTTLVVASADQGYQAACEIDTHGIDAIAVNLEIGVVGAPSYFHVSRHDRSLHYASISLPAGSETSERLSVAVEPPSASLILATAAPARAEIAVHRLQFTPICAERIVRPANEPARWLRSVLLPLPSDFRFVVCRSGER